MLPLNYNLPRTYFELAHIVESIHEKIMKISHANKFLFAEITF